VEEFQKLFVENEVLKDSVTGLQQQYRSTAESNEVSRIFQYLVVEHKARCKPAFRPAGYIQQLNLYYFLFLGKRLTSSNMLIY